MVASASAWDVVGVRLGIYMGAVAQLYLYQNWFSPLSQIRLIQYNALSRKLDSLVSVFASIRGVRDALFPYVAHR